MQISISVMQISISVMQISISVMQISISVMQILDLVVFVWTYFSAPKQIFTGKLPVLRIEKTGFYRPP
jgi:hypothetical protein